MYQGMTEKHMNFDLSKTSNEAADLNQTNERNLICKFCSTVIIWQNTAVKRSHQVSANAPLTVSVRLNQEQPARVRVDERLLARGLAEEVQQHHGAPAAGRPQVPVLPLLPERHPRLLGDLAARLDFHQLR